MFEEVEPDRSFASWLLQLLLAYFGPLIVLGITEALLNIPDTMAPQILEYVAVGVFSAGAAALVSTVVPNALREGRAVWILPAGVEIIGILSELIPHGLRSASLFFFYTPGQGEEAWGVLLLTLPTWSCCCYSATAWWRLRNRTHQRPTVL